MCDNPCRASKDIKATTCAVIMLFGPWCDWSPGYAITPAWCRVLENGNVRFLGVVHRGLPLLLRPLVHLIEVWKHGHDAVEPDRVLRLPGCGCIDSLKTMYERLVNRGSMAHHSPA